MAHAQIHIQPVLQCVKCKKKKGYLQNLLEIVHVQSTRDRDEQIATADSQSLPVDYATIFKNVVSVFTSSYFRQ